MAFRLIILSVLFLFSSFAQTDKKKRTKKCKVYGTVTSTGAHCGGVRLPNEQMKQLMTPKPISDKTVYIKKGTVNSFDNTAIIAEVKTDASGAFTVELPPGNYFLVDEKKKDRTFYDRVLNDHKTKTEYYSAVDTICLRSWYETPDVLFEVKKGKKSTVTVNYAGRCSWNSIPCVQYTGPLPP
jgi:hypothetical protein